MVETATIGRVKENVLIQAGSCSVTLLPEFGGKISSISLNGQELLQGPLAPIVPRTQTLPFEQSDASGWDECLPSVGPCTVSTSDGPALVPDHGDLWRVPWQVIDADQNFARLRGACFSLPLTLDRALTLTEKPVGWSLSLEYILTNTGRSAVPWSWAAHPLFLAEAGDRLILPPSIHSLRLEGSGGKRLGVNGDTVAWPLAQLSNGGETDLSVSQAPESGIGDKLFSGPLSFPDNWCILERPSAGVRIRVSFDADQTPYLGLWICHGGWPDRPGPKQTCVAMEPATAPVDSLAESGPWSRILDAGETFRWTMQVDFDLI